MGKSKLRNSPICEDCLICTEVTMMHKYNNINNLLVKVKQWDSDNLNNQYKCDNWSYECLLCNSKTIVFEDWKCHIMSLSHLSSSHIVKNVYSNVFIAKDCKVVLYGTQNDIKNWTKKYSSSGRLSGISLLMSEVMRTFLRNIQKSLYYCSHCKKFGNTPIHSDKKSITKLKVPTNYFCKTCRVQFYSSPEMINYHSLTVEHITIKCFKHLRSSAKMNPKRIKLTEPESELNRSKETEKLPIIKKELNIQFPTKPLRLEQLDQSKKNEKLTVTKNKLDIQLPTKPLRLPTIVLNRYLNISQDFVKCKLCGSSVIWDIKSLVSHLSNCEYHYDLTDSNINTSMSMFACTLCNKTSEDITEHTEHIISRQHLKSCSRTNNFYSFFCRECNVFMYCNKFSITSHFLLFHNIRNVGIPVLSMFMANVFKDINENPNKTEFVHYHGDQDCSAISKVLLLCCTCKITFHTSIDDYNIHMTTSEHIILKLMSPNKPVTKENNLVNTVKTPVSKSIVIDPLVQKYHSIIYDNNEQKNNAFVNKNSTNLDDKWTPLLVNVKKLLQRLPVNNVLPDQSYENSQNKNADSYNSIELTLSYSQQCDQYTKYFKHKMKLLNLLRQYKDRVLNTLSYYCIECDIMCEEKLIWDKHNETKHKSHDNRPTVFCSICAMLIVGKTANDHNGTIEHCILLKFINSLKSVEEDLIKKISKVESVKSYTSINTEIEKKQSKGKIISSTKEIFKGPYNVKNIKNNFGRNTIQKSPILNEESIVMKNTLLLKDKDNDQNKYEMNSRTSNAPSLIRNKITPENVAKDKSQNEVVSISDMIFSLKTREKQTEELMISKNKINTYFNDFKVIGEFMSQLSKNTVGEQEVKNSKLFAQAEIKITPEDIDMDKHNKVASILDQSTVPLLTQLSKLIETGQTSEFDKDKAYGKYVTERLKYIKDKTVKRDIKLETLNYLKENIKPEQIVNGEQIYEVSLTNSNMSLSVDQPLTTNASSKNVDAHDYDEEYGQYVTQRLRNLKDQKFNQFVKLNIDFIFYNKLR